MKRFFKLCAVLLFIQFSQLHAQTDKPLRINFGLSSGIPTTANPFGYALGGDIKLQKDISTHTALTFSAGFNHYFDTKNFDIYPDYPTPWNAIPVKLGVKAFVVNHVYLAAEAGAGFFLEGGKPTFIWSPSVGMAFKNGLDLSVKYENFNNYKALNQVAFRIAYGLPVRNVNFRPKSSIATGWELNAAVSPGISLGEGSFVIGGDLQLERYLSDRVALTASAGFTHFSGKVRHYSYTPPGSTTPSYVSYGTDQNLIPIKLGAKAFLNKKLFVAAAAGMGIDINGNSSFVYSGTVGLKLTQLDLGLKYENFSDFHQKDQLAVHLGYRIF
jgi:hypothetical protein